MPVVLWWNMSLSVYALALLASLRYVLGLYPLVQFPRLSMSAAPSMWNNQFDTSDTCFSVPSQNSPLPVCFPLRLIPLLCVHSFGFDYICNINYLRAFINCILYSRADVCDMLKSLKECVSQCIVVVAVTNTSASPAFLE